MNYADEVTTRMSTPCPNARCVLNGSHPLHRNGQGNQWIPTSREGMQAICFAIGCILLTHVKGDHQDKDGNLFTIPERHAPVVTTIRGVDAVTALRNVATNLNAVTSSEPDPERAPHSEHYAAMTLEPIAVIDAWGLGFNLGCVVKYLARPKGQTIADLEKAVWYLQHELDRRRSGAL